MRKVEAKIKEKITRKVKSWEKIEKMLRVKLGTKKKEDEFCSLFMNWY